MTTESAANTDQPQRTTSNHNTTSPVMTPRQGRIIRGESYNSTTTTPKPPQTTNCTPEPTPTPQGRIVARERLDATVAAAEIVSAAKREAESTRLQAEEDAKQIRANAEQQGYQEGIEQGSTKLANAWLQLKSQQANTDSDSIDRSIAIARLLAERLIGKAIEIDPTIVVDLAKQAMTHLWRSNTITVQAHPNDIPPLQLHFDSLKLPTQQIQITPDPSRSRGCIKFTTDFGELDASLGPQLDILAEVTRQELTTNNPK